NDGGQTWHLRFQTLPDSGLVVSSIQDPIAESGLGLGLGVGYLDQAHVSVGPEGDLYVSNTGGGDFDVPHSTDDGQSFTIPNHDTGLGIAFGAGGFATYPNGNGLPTNHFRTSMVRSIAADPSQPGSVFATEAVQVLDPLGNVLDAADIRFAHSTDY